MKTSSNDRESVDASLAGDRRHIMTKPGLPSYRVPILLRWLKRYGLAGNDKKGYWKPYVVPCGIGICWEHWIVMLGDLCHACPPSKCDHSRER